MAISGSGTQADPYVVRDWDELVTAMSGYCVELANDIQAPSSTVSLTSNTLWSLDGKGYAINGLTVSPSGDNPAIYFRRSGTAGGSTIKDISFTNIHCLSNGAFIGIVTDGDYKTESYDNVSFSGIFDNGGILIRGYEGSTYGGDVALRIATNIETTSGAFSLIDSAYDSNRGSIQNSNIVLKYVICTPTRKLCRKKTSDTDIGTISNSLLNLSLEQATNKLDIGAGVFTCAIIGKGNGVIISTGSGVSVVEDTLPLQTSLSNIHSLTTAQMKDAQYLHDLGFPIGVD